jgi:hypothetical protein
MTIREEWEKIKTLWKLSSLDGAPVTVRLVEMAVLWRGKKTQPR